MLKIGDRIREFRKKLNISQEEISKILGTNQKSYSRYENNLTYPPTEILEKLAEVYNFNLHWLITGQGEMFIKNNIDSSENKKYTVNEFKSEYDIDKELENINGEWIAKSSKYILEDSSSMLETGQKNLNLIKVINGDMNSADAIQIPNELKKYEGKLIAIIQKGDDMEPIIRDSSIVLCDTLGFQGAGLYVLKLNNIYMIKRISLKLDNYLLSPDNKLYESFEVPLNSDKLKIGGKVRFVANVFIKNIF
ncbi:XRE family transcriptional regulator [Brachyspira intermedia]|nr:helix-turn-helix domain-containing protein [Brachyspira intermedia]